MSLEMAPETPPDYPTLSWRDIRGGDVLLCVFKRPDADTVDLVQRLGAPYTHAALALSGESVLEATLDGVSENKLAPLVRACLRIAVFRSDQWDQSRLEHLGQFARRLVQAEIPFNEAGFESFESVRQTHLRTIMERLKRHLQQGAPKPDYVRSSYFCSELVVAAFAEVGILGPTSAEVMRPEVFTPPCLGKDKAFGYLRGYVCRPGVSVPSNDLFVSAI